MKESLLRNDLILEDTTLRDGEQAPGVAFPKEAKLEIFHALVDAGVRWIEPGIPAMGGQEAETLQEMLDRKDEVTLIGWNRGVEADVRQSIAMGFRAVHIGLPTSANHLKHSVNKDREWLLRTAEDMVKLGKDSGCFVSISAEDIGRTEIPFLQEYAGRVAEAGADRLRLSDTIGILDPKGYAERVAAVASSTDIDLQAHCHNDFGLGLSNTIAAIEAGVRYFHVAVNGIGERAGMADLAQVVMVLKHFHGVDLGIDTTKLTALAALVASACQQPVVPWQPVVGGNVFAHESGIHTKGMLSDTSTFEPFAPELVGGQRRLIVGKHSGRAVIKHALEQQGVEVDETLLESCLEQARTEAIAGRGEVTGPALRALYDRLREPVGAAAP